MFADKYLHKNHNEALIATPPHRETGLIVVIPCLNEPAIEKTLESIQTCRLPRVVTEVLVAINHSEAASREIKQSNAATKKRLESWIARHNNQRLVFFVIGPLELKKKWAGAGLARKMGMDEALRRFNLLRKEEGIIVSLDADTLVGPTYLCEIEKHYQCHPRHVGATMAFEHLKNNLTEKHRQGIVLYEIYLDYYRRALQFSGYPYALFTIGSAFSVRAGAYVKRGGMNRRQAGEDFYFLQNLAQMGQVGEITATRVYPSARVSDRVPFGTGPILQKWLSGEYDLNKTYAFQSFIDLKVFFDCLSCFFQVDKEGYLRQLSGLPRTVRAFLLDDSFEDELDDLNRNCSSGATFRKRFFQKFNAFKVLKYLNFVTEKYYPKAHLHEQVLLLEAAGRDKDVS